MKKRFLLMVTIIVGLGLTACSVDASGLEDAANDLEEQLEETSDELTEEVEEAENQAESNSSVMYQCPDDCENGPAYFKGGPCKKCGKELEVL